MNNFLKKMANPTRLSLATLYDVVIAAAAAFLCYVAVTNAMGLLAGMMTDQKNYYERHTKLLAEEFQDFVTENHVEIGDGETIGDWNSENWYVFLTVYQRDRIYYNTMDRDNEKLKTELKDEHPGFQYGYLYRHGTAVTYPVKFADGAGEILIRAYFEAVSYTHLDVYKRQLSDNAVHGPGIPDGLFHTCKRFSRGRGSEFPDNPL